MKIVFIKNLPGQGREGEVKEVADGYARNFLIPRGIALPAISGAVQLVQQRRKQTEPALPVELIDGQELHFSARAGTKGRLHGAITASNIAEELEKICDFPIDKRRIVLETPLKELGNYEVAIKLGQDREAKVQVIIEEE